MENTPQSPGEIVVKMAIPYGMVSISMLLPFTQCWFRFWDTMQQIYCEEGISGATSKPGHKEPVNSESNVYEHIPAIFERMVFENLKG